MKPRQPDLFVPYKKPRFETDPARWARLFKGNLAFVVSHLANAEMLAKGKTGREFTRCVRGTLFAYWKERWRDDRVVLERERDRLAAVAAAKPKPRAPFSPHDRPMHDLLRKVLQGVRVRE